MKDRRINILVVDDDTIDVMTVSTALKQLNTISTVSVAGDGERALDMLRASPRPQVDRPLVVLLDLNMPKMNGLEFLKELRRDQILHDTVVFVLTTSNAANDIAAAYSYNVAGYFVKSETGENFNKLSGMLDQYAQRVYLPGSHLN